MRTLLGVEVLEVGQVLEVVGVDAAVLNEGVGGDVVVDDLDLQCDTLLSQNVLDDLEDLGVGRGGRGDADGLAVQRAVVGARTRPFAAGICVEETTVMRPFSS